MCCSGLLRTMMIIFNGIIFLAGAAILAVGVWVKVDSGSLMNFLVEIPNAPEELNQIFYVGYLLIAVGSVLVLMGFLGCCGAIKKSPCMLLTFFVIVLLVFLAEVAGAIVVFVFKPLAEQLIEKLGTEAVISIKKDYGTNQDLTNLWNVTMEGLNCCGFYNYTDFTGSPFFENNHDAYPSTCCMQNSSCTEQQAQQVMVIGCFPELVQLIESNAVILGAVAIGIAALEIAAMVVSMTLYKQTSKSNT